MVLASQNLSPHILSFWESHFGDCWQVLSLCLGSGGLALVSYRMQSHQAHYLIIWRIFLIDSFDRADSLRDRLCIHSSFHKWMVSKLFTLPSWWERLREQLHSQGSNPSILALVWLDLTFAMVMGEETDSKRLSVEVKTKPEVNRPVVRTGLTPQTLSRKVFWLSKRHWSITIPLYAILFHLVGPPPLEAFCVWSASESCLCLQSRYNPN